MARLPKPQLLARVERAIIEGGWRYLRLPSPGGHPARYSVFLDERRVVVRIYIWNLTPGGRNRPLDEWRIQATAVAEFQRETSGKTLILGWDDERGVFVGFDWRRHQGPIGHSPSIQLREAALDAAAADGFAIHNKGNEELAVAFRPDFLVTYIANLEALHDCGAVDAEIEVLQQLGGSRVQVTDTQVAGAIAAPRRLAVLAAKRALRASDFRSRVLGAYGHSCAMCGIQLRLLDAAHILPAAHADSTDGTDNGVALCVLHHRAYDGELVTFDTAFRTHVNGEMARTLREEGHDSGLPEFRRALRPRLALPPRPQDRPARRFIDRANALRGWPPLTTLTETHVPAGPA